LEADRLSAVFFATFREGGLADFPRNEDPIMPLDSTTLRSMIAAAAECVIENADELTLLDQAVGDGDHGINMKRGCAEVLSQLDGISAKPAGEALKAVGMALVMKVGGASGPLYGSLFMAMGKAIGDRPATLALLPEAFAAGVDAVAARGKSTEGEKTMLDVLGPALRVVQAGGPGLGGQLRETASSAAADTIPMLATKGRASYLGERSVGHMDPGARSSQIIIEALSHFLDERP
jgi:phosphoenolpyruvate---glycerone phosphotransferase subunit DhaL